MIPPLIHLHIKLLPTLPRTNILHLPIPRLPRRIILPIKEPLMPMKSNPPLPPDRPIHTQPLPIPLLKITIRTVPIRFPAMIITPGGGTPAMVIADADGVGGAADVVEGVRCAVVM